MQYFDIAFKSGNLVKLHTLQASGVSDLSVLQLKSDFDRHIWYSGPMQLVSRKPIKKKTFIDGLSNTWIAFNKNSIAILLACIYYMSLNQLANSVNKWKFIKQFNHRPKFRSYAWETEREKNCGKVMNTHANSKYDHLKRCSKCGLAKWTECNACCLHRKVKIYNTRRRRDVIR